MLFDVINKDPTAGDEGLAAGDEGPGMGVESHGLDDESRGLDDEGHSVESDAFGLGEEEVVPEGQQQEVPVVGTTVSTPLGLGYGALRCRELALEEDHVYSTFEVGQGSGFATEPKRPERMSASRQPTLTTWIDPLIFLLTSHQHHLLRPTLTRVVVWFTTHFSITFYCFFTYFITYGIIDRSITGKLSPALFEMYDKDIGELFTKSGAVRDEIFSQRYRFKSLEHEQERTVVMFRALWGPMLALKAWAWRFAVRATGDERSCYCFGAGEGP
nr:hypothetical protein [Tanacetum cinerariifolium]